MLLFCVCNSLKIHEDRWKFAKWGTIGKIHPCWFWSVYNLGEWMESQMGSWRIFMVQRKKNTPKRPQCRHYSSIWFTFSIEDNCKDPWASFQWRFQLINDTITGRSTWRSLTIFGCSKLCLDLIVLNARTVKRQKEEVEEFQKREKRAQWLL